tara:strand:+ start:508 stop:2457 length:1950 start_codon:yes stop_codon:yes gene_type:complete
MSIDPKILEEALKAEQELRQDGGITDMLTPEFNATTFAEAGALPDLNLDLSNVIAGGGSNDLSFDPQEFLYKSINFDPELREMVNNEVGSILLNAEAGDEEDGIRAVTAVALDESGATPPEVEEGYKSISDLIQAGGLPAVEQFVRDVYTDDDNTESIPNWALPATVFGTFLMNEPGDWRQAILKARGKTAQTMFNQRVNNQAAKDKLELDIKKKALDLFASGSPTATSLVGLVGKVTPASLAKYEKSGKLSDLEIITSQKDVGELLKDFTVESVAKYQKTDNYADLVRLPGKGEKGTTTLDFLKEFTPASVKLYEDGDRKDPSVLVRKPDAKGSGGMSMEEMTELLGTYTAPSIDKFAKSGLFADLEPKDAGSWTPTVGSTTDAQQEADLNTMETVDFRDNLRSASLADKIKQLRNYSLLHSQTTRKINEKTPAGDILKQRLPLAKFSVEAYATDIGLDLDNPEVMRILNVAKTQLPYASVEDVNRLGALNNVRDKVAKMGAILEATPQDVTGVAGFVFDTNAARIADDLIPGFDIPIGATVSQVFSSVAEVDLIEEILKEARFSDQDRKLVRDFIKGRDFANLAEKKLRHAAVTKIIERNLDALNFKLENYQLPPGMTEEDTRGQDNSEERLNQLRENILNMTNQGD